MKKLKLENEKLKKTCVYLTESLIADVKLVSKKSGVKQSDVIRQLLRFGLDNLDLSENEAQNDR